MTTARPRIAGLDLIRRQSIRPVFEPFTPDFEERDENEAHILRLALPDFDAQHVRFKVDKAASLVRVNGERHMGNNRISHLDYTYRVPQDYIIDKIDHKFANGFLTITMPKETTPQGSVEAEAAAPSPTEAGQATPEKGVEHTSQEDAAQPEPKAETKEEAAQPEPKAETKEDAAQPEPKAETKEPEAALPKVDSNTSSVEKPTDDDKGKSAVLEKQVSEKVKEETPKQKVVEPKAEKGPKEEPKLTPKQEDLGVPKDQKPTQKNEIKDQIPEKKKEKEKEETKGEESKTENVGNEQEKPKMSCGIPPPSVIRPSKLAGPFAIGRLPLPLKANLAAVVMIIAAYFAYTYCRSPSN